MEHNLYVAHFRSNSVYYYVMLKTIDHADFPLFSRVTKLLLNKVFVYNTLRILPMLLLNKVTLCFCHIRNTADAFVKCN